MENFFKSFEMISLEIQDCLEQIAKAVHEEWSRQRIEERWTYGKERNDELKQTPCLVPYEELPESEKEYDRNTALCVIKNLQKLGFSIERRN